MPPFASVDEVVHIQCMFDLNARLGGMEDHCDGEKETGRNKQ